MKRPLILWFLCVTLLVPTAALGQTDTSYRIRSLGVHFRGILDDYLTDIFLNPARTSELDGRMVYAYKIPRRSISVRYPTAYWADLGHAPIEQEYHGYSVYPIAASYIHSSPGGSAFSIGGEAYVSTRDDLDAQQEADFIFFLNTLRERAWDTGRVGETKHYVLDLAYATAPTARSLGLRVRGSYVQDEDQDAETSVTHLQGLSAPRDEELAWRSYRLKRIHERAALLVEAGVHRPDGTIRDIVLSGEVFRDQMTYVKREVYIQDEDIDGNGRSVDGGVPENRFDETIVSSDRDYDGFSLSGWLALDWPGSLRSTHRVSWERSTGGGHADNSVVEEQYGTQELVEASGATYSYDGMTDDVSLDTSVGASTMIVDEVLVGIAAYGIYWRERFDEDGTGDAALSQGGRDNSVDTTLTSPYLQRHDNTADGLGLWIPVGVEWQFHRFAKLRIGLAFSVVRTETDRLQSREVTALTTGLPLPNNDGRSDLRRVSIRSSTSALYNNGLEININDRFILDLLYAATYTSEVYLTRYLYVSARYQF